MARPRSHFKDANEEVIERNVLQENPEGLPTMDEAPVSQKVVVADKVPEMKWIQFSNGRDPGQELMFHYHSKTHPLKHYTLYHGKEYHLPVEIVDHLENCSERQYGYKPGASGHPEMYVKSLKYIFQCKSVKKVA